MKENFISITCTPAILFQPLADGLIGVSNSTKAQNAQEFGSSVHNIVDAISKMVEETAQAAYLVGVADPRSEPGRPGLVDHLQLQEMQRNIQNACQAMQSSDITDKHVSRAQYCFALLSLSYLQFHSI
ncbi:unnamed protein product [Protopolystoma xenopodis]|uniref:Vinculin n=1 Tax=Protopolystoma xenopodis TaxID=117903 RepID=A0A448WES9_9PLAT|nr:unnamed protein product [Protopolystoma xenopodis]